MTQRWRFESPASAFCYSEWQMPFSCRVLPSLSVLLGQFYMVDDEYVDRAHLRHEFEPELLFYIRRDRKPLGVKLHKVVKISCEARLIHDRATH